MISNFSIRIVLAALAAVLLAFGIRMWAVPIWHAIDKDFSYEADVLSLDNFFDETENKFRGEERSVTSFGYRFAGKENGGVLVHNFFRVRTAQGDEIISITRDYKINPYTWRHYNGVDSGNQGGYLFAPRHLQKNSSFSYRHVNYDQDLVLVFEGEEDVGGVATYRYGTSFGADQTQSLKHLSGVPETRGVNLDISLTLWIEPVSGWLVKYEDNAIAYYYDIETGERLHPWNKFSNRYQRASVLKQAHTAQTLKLAIVGFEVFFPIIAFVLTVVIFSWRHHKRISIAAIIGGTIISILFVVWFVLPLFLKKEEGVLLVGVSRWVPYGNMAYDDNIQGFRDALEVAGYIEGKNVNYLVKTADADSDEQERVADFFIENDVDLVYSLTTPGTAILKNKISHRPIVFSMVTYPVRSGLVDTLKHSGNNLVGIRSWIPVQEQLSVFREIVPSVTSIGFVHRRGEANSTIQLEEMRSVAEPLGIKIIEIAGGNLGELIKALENAEEFDGLFSACDTLIQGEAETAIIHFAHSNLIPSFSCNSTGPSRGDLVGFVADPYELGKLAGEKAVLIFEGATPTSLEIGTIARPFLYVNQTTADLLGITISQSILARAKKVFR